MNQKPIVVVGAGHAGVHVTTRLLELGWAGGTVLVDEEESVPYERPPLSKEVLTDSTLHHPPLLRKEAFYSDKGIQTIRGSSVVAIDPQAGVVRLSEGTSMPFHRLVLATGSKARTLPIPGADLEGVQFLKTLEDARALQHRLTPGTRVVIIGAGYIGMEVAAAAAKLGCSTTVLEFQDRVMARVTSPIISDHFRKLHEEHGVRFVFGAQASRFEGSDHVTGVRISDGAEYPADVVVVGVGVVPNQKIAEDAGLECSDGIIVDEHGRTSSPLIYAAGDVTRFQCPWEGVSRRLECVQNAVAQADAVARDILGAPAKDPEVPWFWTVQHGVRLQTAGVRNANDRVIVRGEPATGKFSVLYLRDGDKLAAIDTVHSLGDFAAGKKLIAAGARVNPSQAVDPSIKLAQVALSIS